MAGFYYAALSTSPALPWPVLSPPCTDGGAEHWAVLASLIETCKLIGVEPQAYLAEVITRTVNSHPQSRLDELLPRAYRPTPAPQGSGLRTALTADRGQEHLLSEGERSQVAEHRTAGWSGKASGAGAHPG
jgi:hypothetical protein